MNSVQNRPLRNITKLNSQENNLHLDSKNLSWLWIILFSFALLILSCVDNDDTGRIIKLVWLASFACANVAHFAGAFAIYIAANAIYSVRHFEGWGSIYERPDNFALAILIISFVFMSLKQRVKFRFGILGVLIILFTIFSLGQMASSGLLTRYNFAWFMRMFGLPFLLFLILKNSSILLKEFKGFLWVMMILGFYIAGISIMERLDFYSLIIPGWIGDPSLNFTIGTGRSGGLLLQSEWNGFVLSLIYCLILGLGFINGKRNHLIESIAVCLCLIGIFFTYTRAAWLSVMLATLFLLIKSHQLANWGKIRRIVIICAVIISVAFIALFPTKTARERTGDIGTVYFRLNLWTAGLRMIAQKPLFGSGFGQFQKNVVEYHDPSGEIPYTKLQEETVAHNTYISIMVEQGIVGFALYILIFGMICLEGLKSISLKLPKSGPLWLISFIVIYIINIQFVVAYDPTTNFIFFGTMGIIAGFSKRQQRSVCKKEKVS